MATPTSDSHPQFSDAYGTPTPTNSSPSETSTSSSDNNNNNNNNKNSESSIYRYYFAFLAVLAVVFVVTVWLIYRRKSKLARRQGQARQNALSRDVEGANINRGWTYGDWRIREAMAMGPWRRREEDGLNEAGEAPPPYKPRTDDDAAIVDSGQRPTSHNDSQRPLSAPQPTLGRDQAGLKPPDYSETIARPVTPDDLERGPSSSSVGLASETAETAAHAAPTDSAGHVPDIGHDTSDRPTNQ